jgi:hypothetical protein
MSAIQPDRSPENGMVQCERTGKYWALSCEENGSTSTVLLSPFNAWRAFACLAQVLAISLPNSLVRKITL